MYFHEQILGLKNSFSASFYRYCISGYVSRALTRLTVILTTILPLTSRISNNIITQGSIVTYMKNLVLIDYSETYKKLKTFF